MVFFIIIFLIYVRVICVDSLLGLGYIVIKKVSFRIIYIKFCLCRGEKGILCIRNFLEKCIIDFIVVLWELGIKGENLGVGLVA